MKMFIEAFMRWYAAAFLTMLGLSPVYGIAYAVTGHPGPFFLSLMASAAIAAGYTIYVVANVSDGDWDGDLWTDNIADWFADRREAKASKANARLEAEIAKMQQLCDRIESGYKQTGASRPIAPPPSPRR